MIIGNSAANNLTGNAGDDILDGGAGADTLIGGIGDDTYVVDNAGDVVTESADEGTDTVQSSISFSLASLPNIENVTLTGTAAIDATGNATDNRLIGNSAANVLNADGGNDFLDGGLGADTLIGGTGDDTYVVDQAGDVVTENANEGTDTVRSAITYVLDDNLENLTLTGIGNINGTGNAADNSITGNSGNNILTGGVGSDYLDGWAGADTMIGGTGADTMIGGTGDDTYVVDNAGDVVTENANEGTDTVNSAITYTLVDKPNLEDLTLTGVAAINGAGNGSANSITGNNGANILDGGGGNDTLLGGAGDDT
ncbi:MAG: Na-Ca exchanger/integrin-beta4, partial [Gammaproteobacteria bacterium]